MNVAVVTVGKEQKGKFSKNYRCVKVKDIKTEKLYTLNIGSYSSLVFKPHLKVGNIFHGVQARTDNPEVIDVTKGFDWVVKVRDVNTKD